MGKRDSGKTRSHKTSVKTSPEFVGNPRIRHGSSRVSGGSPRIHAGEERFSAPETPAPLKDAL